MSHQLPQDVCSAVSVRDPPCSILTNEQFIIRTPGDLQTSLTELGLGSGSRCVRLHLEGTCDSCGAHGRCCLRRSQENASGPPWFWAQFLHWLRLATRWRQTSEDGHGHGIPHPPEHQTPSPTEGTRNVSVSPKQECSGHCVAAGQGSCRMPAGGGGAAEATAGTHGSGGRSPVTIWDPGEVDSRVLRSR